MFNALWRLLPAVLLVSFLGCPEPVLAQTYYRQGQVLYEKYPVQESYTYWWYGKQYSAYRTVWKYREVLNYSKPDWRQQALNLIDKQKERESFESVLDMMGVQGLMAPKTDYADHGFAAKFAQTPYSYPSAAGTTVGGFSYYEKTKYGDVTPYDVNKADERAHLAADSVMRMTAEISAVAGTAVNNAAGLQKMNMERVGAIAEIQEMRALLRERAYAEKEKALAETERLKAEAEVFRSLKPAASESVRQGVRFDAGTEGGGNSSAALEVPPPPPVPSTPGMGQAPHPGAALAVKYCGDCHAGSKTNPVAGYRLDVGIPLSVSQFQATKLRMDEDAPNHRMKLDGQNNRKPFKMPPPDYAQPTRQERELIVEFARSNVVE